MVRTCDICYLIPICSAGKQSGIFVTSDKSNNFVYIPHWPLCYGAPNIFNLCYGLFLRLQGCWCHILNFPSSLVSVFLSQTLFLPTPWQVRYLESYSMLTRLDKRGFSEVRTRTYRLCWLEGLFGVRPNTKLFVDMWFCPNPNSVLTHFIDKGGSLESYLVLTHSSSTITELNHYSSIIELVWSHHFLGKWASLELIQCLLSTSELVWSHALRYPTPLKSEVAWSPPCAYPLPWQVALSGVTTFASLLLW